MRAYACLASSLALAELWHCRENAGRNALIVWCLIMLSKLFHFFLGMELIVCIQIPFSFAGRGCEDTLSVHRIFQLVLEHTEAEAWTRWRPWDNTWGCVHASLQIDSHAVRLLMTSLAQDKVLSQNGYGGRIKACIGIYMYLSVYLGIYMYLCIYMYLSVLSFSFYLLACQAPNWGAKASKTFSNPRPGTLTISDFYFYAFLQCFEKKAKLKNSIFTSK